MARIAGVNIPTNKRVVIALTYIHGIGPAHAKAITEKLEIAPERRGQDLTDKRYAATVTPGYDDNGADAARSTPGEGFGAYVGVSYSFN